MGLKENFSQAVKELTGNNKDDDRKRNTQYAGLKKALDNDDSDNSNDSFKEGNSQPYYRNRDDQGQQDQSYNNRDNNNGRDYNDNYRQQNNGGYYNDNRRNDNYSDRNGYNDRSDRQDYNNSRNDRNDPVTGGPVPVIPGGSGVVRRARI